MEKDIKFISTKLKMPVPRKNYIRREKLLQKLENILNYKVTLVKGGAARGKTTLVTSFVSEKALKNVKWISLDKDNDDLFSFWYYFLEAIKDSLGSKSEEIFDFFNGLLSKEEIEKLVTMLINLTNTEEKIIIILDDFQSITDSYLLKTIECFIKHSGDNVHFILLSRQELEIYFGDLVMSDSLQEINEDELRFSLDEGRTFLKDTLKMNFNDEFISKINSVSEGWVGGLQLIALASNNKAINEVKILNKYMIDYLSKEILNSLNDKEKDFLIKTSVLGYFDEKICNELLQISDSKEIINGLLEKNLFLVNIDEAEGLFRYHNILGEFLKLEFLKLDKKVIENIHLKAAKIFQELRDLDESLNHLIPIERYEEALNIIEKFGQNAKGWAFLDRIPFEYILANRNLTLQKFFHHFCNGEMEACNEIFMAASVRKDYEDMKNVLHFAIAVVENKFIKIDIVTFEEIDSINVSDVSKAILYLVIATFLSIADNYEIVNELIDRIISIENKYKNPYLRYYSLNSKAQIKEELGDLTEAEAIYEEIFKMIEVYPILERIKANAYIGIIGIYLKSFQLGKADEYIKKSKDAINKSFAWMEYGYLYNLLEYKILSKDSKGVKKLLDEAVPFSKGQYVVYSGILNFSMISGNADEEKLQSYVYNCENEEKLFIADKLIYAKALIKLGESEKALEIINEILEISRKHCIKIKLVQAVLLKIEVLNNDFKYNKREILNLLTEAIYYSYENKIISPYITEAENIMKLLVSLKNERSNSLNRGEKDFINEILIHMGKPQKRKFLVKGKRKYLRC